VFISYAHVDNEPSIPGDDATRWVNTLRQSLQIRIDQKLGRKDAVRIWMDRGGLAGHEPVTQRIREAISSSAILVVAFSNGYLESPWCQQERELFIEAAGGVEKASSRFFLVHLDEIPRDRWPKMFSDDIGYQFYQKEPVTGLVSRLADPMPDPQEKAYWTELNKLRTEIAYKLEQLQRLGATNVPPTSVADRVPLSNGKTAIFLAETTQALNPDRDAVAAFLLDQGYDVYPTRFYSRDPITFVRAMEVDLTRAAVFVQLLGEDSSIRTEELPHGYEGLQLERARTLGCPMLRWRRKDLEVAKIRDETHRRFLQEVDVMTMDLEDFKGEIVRALKRHEVRQELPQRNGEMSVLINANAQDLRVADEIINDLQHLNIALEILSEEAALDAVLDAEDYDVVMVVYGICAQDWVQQRVRVLRQLALGKKGKAPLCAVYIGHPPLDQKDPLRCRFPTLRVIDRATLGAFLPTLGKS
jgi:TIR domain